MKKKNASRIEDDVDKLIAGFGANTEDSTWLFIPELFFKWAGWAAGLAGIFIISSISDSQAILFAFYIGLLSVILYSFSFFGKLIESINTKTIRGGIAKVIAGALAAFLFLMYFLGCFKVIAVFQTRGLDQNLQPRTTREKFDILNSHNPICPEISFAFENLKPFEFSEKTPDNGPPLESPEQYINPDGNDNDP